MIQVGADNSSGHPPQTPRDESSPSQLSSLGRVQGQSRRLSFHGSLALEVLFGSALRWLLLSGGLLTLSGLLEG